jgi:hypothetical protein
MSHPRRIVTSVFTTTSTLVTSAAAHDPHFTANEALLAAAGLTALVAIVVPLVNARLQRRINERAAGEEMRRRTLERRTQQLNELYGPVLLLRRQSYYLSQKLREGKAEPDNWHILDHVQEVLSDPTDAVLAQIISGINEKIEDHIVNHAGLLYTAGPPESWVLFLGHCRVLRMALEGGAVPALNEFSYFPSEFDRDLQEAYDALRAEVDEMMTGGKR